MPQHQDGFNLNIPLIDALTACHKAVNSLGWRVIKQGEKNLVCKEPFSFSFTSPVQIEITLNSRSTGSTSVTLNGSSSGLGPLQSNHLSKQMVLLFNGIALASGTGPAVRTCRHCHIEIPEGSGFCPKCGKETMSDISSTGSSQGAPPRSKRTKIITWAIIVVLNAVLFILALTKKPVAGVYMPVSVLLGLVFILFGMVMFVIGLFKKKLRRYGMLTTLGVALFIMGIVVAAVNPAETRTATSPDGSVKVSPGLASTSGDNLAEILGRSAKTTSVTFDAVTSAPGQSPLTGKMWVKGNKFRAEENSGDRSVVYIRDANTQTLYTYIPAQKMATRERISAESGSVWDMSPAGAARKILREKPVVITSEKVDGKDSLVIEATDKDGQKYRAWIWKEYGFTIRAEVIATQDKWVIEWKNIQFVDNADSLFELPPGVLVTPAFKDVAEALISNVDVPQGSRVYGLGLPFFPETDVSIRPDFSLNKPIVFHATYPTFFFFIDDAPAMRFNHPVRYVLFESLSDRWRWKTYDFQTLPTVNGQDWEVKENITVKGTQVTVLREFQKPQGGTSSRRPAAQPALQVSKTADGFLALVREHLLLSQTAYAQSNSRKVAIVLDGSEPPKKYREKVADKFYEDAQNMAGVLRTLGYNTRFYSGHVGTHALPVDGKELENQIIALSKELHEGDSFVLYLGGHGSKDGFDAYSGLAAESEFLFGKGESVVSYQQLADSLKKIDSKVKMEVYIDACESGGAVDYIKKARPGTTVITAADANTLTPVGIGGEKSFSDHVQDGFQGKAADSNNNGKIDPDEAFSYAAVQNNRGGAAVSVLPPSTTGTTPEKAPPPVTPIPPAGKPDLTVTSVSFSPSSGKSGQTLSVTFTVKNQGAVDSGPFSNRISLATTQYGTNYSLGNFAMEPLKAGAIRPVTVPITTSPIPSTVPEGSYRVTVFADGFQQITESDENNNIGSSDPARFTLQAEAAAVSATITSATATVKMETNRNGSYGTLTVVASGTASGPVGAVLQFRYDLISPKYGRVSQDQAPKSTGGWAVKTTYGALERKAGEPESITWTYTVSGINMATDAYPGVDTELTVSIAVPNSYDPPVTKTMRIKAN